ncbi:MAG: hypothetical protein M5U25_01375 [Planctomycetota bacterium]|nr:hypothetical protein [Planctomycetota bacterium]
MFDFERLFICREFRVEKSGISAEAIGFSHPADSPRILLFGHVLTPNVARPIRYTLQIETLKPDGMVTLGPWPYTLVPTTHGDRRILLAWIPVRNVLAPGSHDAIIEIEKVHSTRVGFEVI